jgi:hypothetical protein
LKACSPDPLPSFQARLIRQRKAAFALWDKLAMAGEYFLCSRCGARAKAIDQADQRALHAQKGDRIL